MLLRTDNFNALTTDLDLNGLDQAETDVVDVTGVLRQGHLQVHAVDQITVTGDLSRHTLAEAGRSVNFYTRVFTLFW